MQQALVLLLAPNVDSENSPLQVERRPAGHAAGASMPAPLVDRGAAAAKKEPMLHQTRLLPATNARRGNSLCHRVSTIVLSVTQVSSCHSQVQLHVMRVQEQAAPCALVMENAQMG
jgi:hypothetical protein